MNDYIHGYYSTTTTTVTVIAEKILDPIVLNRISQRSWRKIEDWCLHVCIVVSPATAAYLKMVSDIEVTELPKYLNSYD